MVKKAMRVLPPVLAAALLTAVFSGCGNKKEVGDCVKKGTAAADKGDWETALKFADKGVENSPQSVDALLLKAVSAQRCGKLEDAYNAAAQAVKLAPNNFSAQYMLGSVCMEIPGRQAEALNAFKAALALREDDRDTLIAICNLMADTNDKALLNYLHKLEQLDPEFAKKSASFHNQMGIARLRILNIKMALESFNKALKLCKENDPTIVYNAASAYDQDYKRTQKITRRTEAKRLYGRYLQLTRNDKSAAPIRAAVEKRIKALR